ncbi:MAG: hypothetical protein GC204_07780 [Chloroflexi bacterium]|nr:hypothetical protein [Chloroflexota bacterium]
MNQNTTRIVIVVLVLVVIVFFVGIGVGAGGQNNGQGGLPGLSVDSVVNRLGGLVPAPAVEASEITASPSPCFDSTLMRIRVQNAGSCHLTIADSDKDIRALKLQIEPGQRVHIDSTSDPVKDKPLESKLDLPSGGNAQITLNFFKENGSVTINNCVPNSGNLCVLNIVQ